MKNEKNLQPFWANSCSKFFADFVFFFSLFRYKDGTVRLRNPHIELMDQDILYHLALGSGSHDLQEMFGDVKVSKPSPHLPPPPPLPREGKHF